MRLFVAVDVPDEIKDAIETGVVGLLRDRIPGARWTRPEGRHLTLKFFGETPDERVKEIARALRKAARRHDAFELTFGDVGGFPNIRRPQVLWLGMGSGTDELAAVAASVERELQPLGFPGEARPFRGHFTLARFQKPGPIGELPSVEVPATPFAVRDVVLFRSQLHPKGARYSILERLPLRT